MHYPDLELYIGGHWKKAPGQPVLNPVDESVLGTVPGATRSDLDAGLAAAGDGFKTWSKTPLEAIRDHAQGRCAHARADRGNGRCDDT